jgi:hypothetical protein
MLTVTLATIRTLIHTLTAMDIRIMAGSMADGAAAGVVAMVVAATMAAVVGTLVVDTAAADFVVQPVAAVVDSTVVAVATAAADIVK